MEPARPLTIAPLTLHRELVPALATLFVAEWPDWYGPGGRGDALTDLSSFAASDCALPVGLVALEDGQPVGVAALKPESLLSHRHLGPWAAAGLVLLTHRGRGIGGQLLEALVERARELGYPRIYCATSTAVTLLRRSGWIQLETVQHEGEAVAIFTRATA